MLEDRVHNHGGKFKLVKVNVDEFGQIAGQVGVEVLPAVYLVMNGDLLDQFNGVVGDERLDEFFSKI